MSIDDRDREVFRNALEQHDAGRSVYHVLVGAETRNKLTVLKRICDSLGIGQDVLDPQAFEDSKLVAYDYDTEIFRALDAINDELTVGLYCCHVDGDIVLYNCEAI